MPEDQGLRAIHFRENNEGPKGIETPVNVQIRDFQSEYWIVSADVVFIKQSQVAVFWKM